MSPQSGDRGLQRLICFKYYNVLKLEIRFTLGLNAAENNDYMKKKALSKNCLESSTIHTYKDRQY